MLLITFQYVCSMWQILIRYYFVLSLPICFIFPWRIWHISLFLLAEGASTLQVDPDTWRPTAGWNRRDRQLSWLELFNWPPKNLKTWLLKITKTLDLVCTWPEIWSEPSEKEKLAVDPHEVNKQHNKLIKPVFSERFSSEFENTVASMMQTKKWSQKDWYYS